MGKLLVIDGLDGSGKATQTARLMQALREGGEDARAISFPDYSDPSSALVKLYLNGELSETADDVNAYAASSFYAVDRYASFKRYWEKDYRGGALIVADRYVSSNAIHQMAKLPREEWDGFLEWLDDYEYGKLGLPRPDAVLYLDMHPDVSAALLKKRYGGDEKKKDIHEKNVAYLLRCRETALYAAQKLRWQVIGCCDELAPLPVETIHKKIMGTLRKELKFLW